VKSRLLPSLRGEGHGDPTANSAVCSATRSKTNEKNYAEERERTKQEEEEKRGELPVKLR